MQPIGPCPAKYMIIGEAPSERELSSGVPFSGFAGQELSKILFEVGIHRSQCFMTYVLDFQIPGNDPETLIALKKKSITEKHVPVYDKMVMPAVRDSISRLAREIEMCRPDVIIALGNFAMFALTGAWGITSWRGSMLECQIPLALDYKPQVLAAYNPNWIMGQWELRPVLCQDLRRAKSMAVTRELVPPDYRFIIRPNFERAVAILEDLLAAMHFKPVTLAVDIETRSGHISCIGLAWSELNAICIPLMCVEREEGYWTLEEEATIVHLLYQLLTHENAVILGQNFQYDSQYIYRHWHFIPKLSRDTMLAQHSCFSNLPKGLDFLSSMYCQYHAYWKDEGKEWNPSIPEEQHWTYNCKDCVITFEVDRDIQYTINQLKLREVADFQQSLHFPVLRTMNRGVRPNLALRDKFAMELSDEIAKREQWIIDVLGFPLNIQSPAQMKELFYDILKQKPVLNRKTKQPSTDEESLRKLASREPLLKPLCNKILELRSLGVFLSTFVTAPLDTDSRIRCSFNIAGTETYRFASRKNAFGTGLNLQNIPKGGDMGDELELPNVRNLFIPDPGYTFFDIDLSSADLRIVVWESDEPEMKAMLAEGLDPYTEIAKEFYHDPSITKKDPRRQTFKSFAHGTNYLGTAKGLAERLGLSVHEATQTQKWYFNRFPRIKVWQDNLCDQVTKRRMVENIFGYRMYFFQRIEGTIFNQAAAWIPQSTVGCLINRAYVEIDKKLPEVQILLQVHDSLAGQYPTHLGTFMRDQIVEKSQIALPYDDPLIIPVGVKTSAESWGACG